MKIEELSIGDWVRHTFYEENVQIVRIYGDSERVLAERGKMSISCHLNHFEPIPLTPEILEKNGFVKSELVTVIEWYHWKDIYIGFKDGLIYTSINGREIWGMRHVHQLQHILRLAGIEKEIEL